MVILSSCISKGLKMIPQNTLDVGIYGFCIFFFPLSNLYLFLNWPKDTQLVPTHLIGVLLDTLTVNFSGWMVVLQP